tara:strand:+ start:736 stop:1584 length:849 start_codon:yes stop_codon:yes gene_type:complete
MPIYNEKDKQILNLKPSTLETVDQALFDWLDKTLNLHVDTNEGYKKVPIIWISAERAYQVKRAKELRDTRSGALILPIITIERTEITKTKAFERPVPAHLPARQDAKGGSYTVYRRIQQPKTANFANADSKRITGQVNFPRKNKKVVYQTISVPYPTYLDMKYKIRIRTEYMQQMNDIVAPFQRYPGGINKFMIFNEGHRFESFMEDSYNMSSNAANLGDEEKQYISEVMIKVLGYTTSMGSNQETPNIVIRENAVKIRIQRERVVLGDSNELNDRGESYRS